MQNLLNDLDIATISASTLQKILDTEKAINTQKSGGSEDIYLLALTRPGR